MDYSEQTEEIDDGEQRDDNDDYISVKDRTRQFGGAGSPTTNTGKFKDHKPYKYDDALKYRFPEKKEYVSAHNYVPVGAIINKSKKTPLWDTENAGFKSRQGWRSKDQLSIPDKRSASNYAANRNMFQSSAANTNNRFKGDNDEMDVNEQRNRHYPTSTSRPTIGFGGITSKKRNDSATKPQPYGVYQYDDENSMINSTKDGSHRIRGQPMSTNRSSNSKSIHGNEKHISDYKSNDFNYSEIHPIAVAQITGEKAYFTMKPRIYDYDDNQYHAMSVDDMKMDGQNDFSDHYLA
ncbi:hypothetical protein GJ496_010707 [Pomphorhynchus laevis]|nr:hypothetical protein GJ496_010707 [Pomphorhynchus laevis]